MSREIIYTNCCPATCSQLSHNHNAELLMFEVTDLWWVRLLEVQYSTILNTDSYMLLKRNYLLFCQPKMRVWRLLLIFILLRNCHNIAAANISVRSSSFLCSAASLRTDTSVSQSVSAAQPEPAAKHRMSATITITISKSAEKQQSKVNKLLC